MKIQGLIVLFALPAGVLSAQVSMFEGGAGRPGNVLNVGPAPERPPELQGIVLLPIECIGRTQLAELLPDQPRLRTDVPGAARIVLPGEQGSLYKYRRDGNGAAPTSFGYFLVDAEGVARRVFELPGYGVGLDPIPGRVAVSATGSALLVATDEDAGGDLWEIDLAAGAAVNRTGDIGPQEFEENGLALLGGWGVAVAEDRVLRFERAAGARASAVNVPGSPHWFGEDIVRSADGSTVAFQAGDDDDEALVFVCRRGGDAQQVSTRPADLSSAGFLPEHPAGPKLALSTDGSWVAWKVSGVERECWARETQGSSRAPELHVTDDAHFDDTLNDTGVIAFFDSDSLAMVVGFHGAAGIVRGDLFRVDLTRSSTAFTVTNLSGTSGITQPPFDYGYLDTTRGIYQVPGPGAAFVIHAYDHAREPLLWVDSSGSTTELLDEVESLDSIDVAGTYLVAGITRPPGIDDPLHESLELLQIPRSGQGATITVLPGGCCLSRHVGSRSRNDFAAVLGFANGEWLGRMHVPDPRGLSLSNSFLEYGPTAGMTAGGEVLASVLVGSARVAFAWSDFGTQTLRSSTAECFILPGL